MARKKADEEKDDRVLAFPWFARELLQEEVRRGAVPAQIARECGLDKNQVGEVLNHGTGFGWTVFLRLTPRLRRGYGEFIEEALTWWEKHGRRVRAAAHGEWKAEADAAVQRASKSSRSGQMPAVTTVTADAQTKSK